MATFKPLTREQFQQARDSGFSPERIVEMEKVRKGESKVDIERKPEKKNVFRKVAEFIAPTTTGLITGEKKLGFRTGIGAALEVGSFFVPVGGIARGLGLAGKGALTLGRKAALGAATGAVAGGAFEAGRAIGDEELGLKEITERTARGTVFGGAFGGAIPAALPAIRAGRRGLQTLRKAPIKKVLTETAQRTKRLAEAGIESTEGAVTAFGRRTTEKVRQFAEKRAEQKVFLAGKPQHIREAVSKKINRPVIDFVTKASKVDKVSNVKMLDLAIKGKNNLSFRGQAKQIPGQTIVQGPVAHLIQVRNAGVAQTKKVLDNLGGKKQNIVGVYNQFIQDMADFGVVASQGKLIPTRGSKIPQNDIKFYQDIFNQLSPAKGKTPLTFSQMHGLRQKWFDVAKADKTFTGGPVSYARRIRSLLGKEIDKAAKGKYIAAQTKTREAMDGLQDYVRLTGFKGKIEDVAAKDLKAGEVFLRVFGNAADRPTSVLTKVYNTARKHGYKGKENIFDQLRFADILEDMYGSPTRGLRGQVGRGVSDADPISKAFGAAREAVKWSPVAAAFRLVRGALAGTADDTVRAFENMVFREGGRKAITTFGTKTGSARISEIAQEVKKAAKPLTDEAKNVFGRQI